MTHCSVCGWSNRSKTKHDMNNATHKTYRKVRGSATSSNKESMVYLCQTYDDSHKSQIICIKDNLTSAQEWSRNRTDMIAKAIRLKSAYFLARPRSKESTKLYSKYYNFREKHKLYHEEQTHSPFVWSMVLEK